MSEPDQFYHYLFKYSISLYSWEYIAKLSGYSASIISKERSLTKVTEYSWIKLLGLALNRIFNALALLGGTGILERRHAIHRGGEHTSGLDLSLLSFQLFHVPICPQCLAFQEACFRTASPKDGVGREIN